MKKYAVLVLFLAASLIAVPPAPAQVQCFGFNASVKPSGFEQSTVSTASVPMVVPDGATLAIVTVEDADIRWRVDGTAATATVGHLLAEGSSMVVCGRSSMRNFSAIRDDATDAIVTITYYTAG